MFFCELFCLYFLHVIVSFSHNPVFAHILDYILNLVWMKYRIRLKFKFNIIIILKNNILQ